MDFRAVLVQLATSSPAILVGLLAIAFAAVRYKRHRIASMLAIAAFVGRKPAP